MIKKTEPFLYVSNKLWHLKKENKTKKREKGEGGGSGIIISYIDLKLFTCNTKKFSNKKLKCRTL